MCWTQDRLGIVAVWIACCLVNIKMVLLFLIASVFLVVALFQVVCDLGKLVVLLSCLLRYGFLRFQTVYRFIVFGCSVR